MILEVMGLICSVETRFGMQDQMLLLYLSAFMRMSQRSRWDHGDVWKLPKRRNRAEREEIETSVSSEPSVLRSSAPSAPSAPSKLPDTLHLLPIEELSITQPLLIRGRCVAGTEIRVGEIQRTLRSLVDGLRRA